MNTAAVSQGQYFKTNSFFLLLIALAVLVGVVSAMRLAWTCDDATISFRYVTNLLDGKGLVYNSGEHVEGYTNFLWTMWCALGAALGFDLDRWTSGWGIAFFAASILLLGASSLRYRSVPHGQFGIPLAAVIAALHKGWVTFATSGLETSAFTFLVLAGYTLLTWNNSSGERGATAAGLLLALACLTRPDGVIFAGIGALYVVWKSPQRMRQLIRYVAPLAIVLVPFLVWRVWYYGTAVPNTYYAKSAYMQWYEQGLLYLRLFAQQYWALIAFPLLTVGIAALFPLRTNENMRNRFLPVTDPSTMLALTVLLMYSFYVVRVGGDFMHARLFIPVVPFLAIVCERSILCLAAVYRPGYLVAVLLMLCGTVFTGTPLSARTSFKGIADERSFYLPSVTVATDSNAVVLERCLHDLPVRAAFLGGEARLMWKARVPVAIEAETGLTDSAIAHQKLTKRGRIGHEKHPSISYLVKERRTQFIFGPADQILRINDSLPECSVQFGRVRAAVIRWEPWLMAELRNRGAVCNDFPQRLDHFIGNLNDMPDSTVAATYEKFRMFYFDHVPDVERERAIVGRMKRHL